MYACPRNLCFAGFDVFFLGRIALAGRFPWHGLIQSLAMFFLTWNTKLDFPLKWKRSCARSQTPGSLAHTGFPRRVSVASWEVVVLQTGKTNTSTIMIHHHPSSVRVLKNNKKGPDFVGQLAMKKTWKNRLRHPGIHTEVWNTVFVLRIILGCLPNFSFGVPWMSSLGQTPWDPISRFNKIFKDPLKGRSLVSHKEKWTSPKNHRGEVPHKNYAF